MAGSKILTSEQQFNGEIGLLSPGSLNYMVWEIAAEELGIKTNGQPVDTGQVYAERARMIREMGMAPTQWTGEHAQVARLVTALKQARRDMTNLSDDDLNCLSLAVEATTIHVEGALAPERAETLKSLAPLIGACTTYLEMTEVEIAEVPVA